MSQEQVGVELHSLPDACRKLGGISPWTLRKHIQRKNVSVTRLGNRVFLKSEEIERIRNEGLPSLRIEAQASC